MQNSVIFRVILYIISFFGVFVMLCSLQHIKKYVSGSKTECEILLIWYVLYPCLMTFHFTFVVMSLLLVKKCKLCREIMFNVILLGEAGFIFLCDIVLLVIYEHIDTKDPCGLNRYSYNGHNERHSVLEGIVISGICASFISETFNFYSQICTIMEYVKKNQDTHIIHPIRNQTTSCDNPMKNVVEKDTDSSDKFSPTEM